MSTSDPSVWVSSVLNFPPPLLCFFFSAFLAILRGRDLGKAEFLEMDERANLNGHAMGISGQTNHLLPPSEKITDVPVGRLVSPLVDARSAKWKSMHNRMGRTLPASD